MRPLLLAVPLAACTVVAAAPLEVEDAPVGRPGSAAPLDGGPLVATMADAGPLRLERTCDGGCTFEPAGSLPADPQLFEMCSWFFDHLETCGLGVSLSRADCPRIARTGGEPLVRYFDCVLRDDCTPNPPACRIAPSSLGGDLSATRATRCPDLAAMSEDRRALLDDLGAQRKAAVIALAAGCVATQPCEALDPCLEAWLAL